MVVAFGGFVLAIALVAFYLARPEPRPAQRTPPTPGERSRPQPAAKDEHKPQSTQPEVPSRTARREPVRSAPKPSPAPRPVESAADKGTLHIDSDVAGAQVFIDRVFIGATPVTASNVVPGTHRLNVSAPGFDGVAQTVDVAAGPHDIVIKLKEVRLDAKIAVVHKHRMGSCQGQLIATPSGIRYDTTDKDDAFNVPLADLEAFQVNYLEKNLRLKVRNGRRYDFTDPAGNADRLFVFHRDVETARDRLKKGDPPAVR
jgi:hypothetical protein